MKKIKEHPFFWSSIFALVVVSVLDADTAASLLLVYFFVGMFWLLARAIKAPARKRTRKAHAKQQKNSAHPTQTVRQASVKLPPPPARINGCLLSYNSRGTFVNTEDRSIFALPGVEIGQTVDFYRDRNNADAGAVAVLLDGCIIGYLYDNKTRNMVKGWLKTNRPLFAQISHVNPSEKIGLKIDIAFYK